MLLQFITSIHKQIPASILEVRLVLEIQHFEGQQMAEELVCFLVPVFCRCCWNRG